MDTHELRTLLHALDNESAITAAFPGWLADQETYLPLMRAVVAEAAAQPGSLESEPTRQELRLSLLYLALVGDREAQADFLKILRDPNCLAFFPQDDWLFNEIPKVLSRLLTPAQLPLLGELILQPEMPIIVREQLLMCIMFRWLSKANSSHEISNVLQMLLENRLGDLNNPQLSMALLVNAIAIDGKNLKAKILHFYHQSGQELAKILPEKTLQVFFGLGKDKLKNLLLQNYDSDFSDSRVELQKVFHPLSKEEQESQLSGQSKTIVREAPKINRNATCPCGSGKKYKKCCGQ